MDRPRVIINVAQSLNGMIAGPGGRRVTISSAQDRERVLEIRSKVDAVIVGANTVVNDNPRLNLEGHASNHDSGPMRVVLDGSLKIPDNSHILDGTSRTVVFTWNLNRELKGADLIRVSRDHLTVKEILDKLWSMGIRNVLVEGGKQVIHEFIDAGAVDEFHIFVGNILIERGGMILFDPPEDISGVARDIRVMQGGLLISLDPHSLMIAWKKKAKAF
ncbi:MAG: dihydrofolate reductase family protein [Candidatus Thermoplasmatota archaeon]|nr:dihydrofolate reductase family protein [Candidatus Thermoplasmatota archaeon]MCL5880969.1 dihydrofolate reductase family protein [Candidatus Thermoplasmatota archaeon]